MSEVKPQIIPIFEGKTLDRGKTFDQKPQAIIRPSQNQTPLPLPPPKVK